MSKQIYDETQSFLEDKWGPLGGWAQAVMFAADLKTTTTPKTTPVKQRSSTTIEAQPTLVSDHPDVKPVQDKPLESSPLKRKSATAEFKRTRSATKLSLQRTDSTQLVDKVEDLQV